ncbi:MAG: excinuclease ABC subunit UvrC [Clostridia bacterium]|nr:excinuclease ABC subunit UvrC [Clostridia bacterium]
MEKLTELKAKANRLPKSPGVYIMKDKSGKIIYIGKAKALKNRVTQYFGAGNQHTPKVRQMVSFVDDFEYIICDSEFEALILENSLIKQNQPKYNILLKDDKGYHYIKISDEKWPRITTCNQVDRRGEFIGPYYSSMVVKDTVEEVRKIFKLPDCNRSFDKPTKPCLNFHIGLCDAPCRCKISHGDYMETVKSAVEFIKKGDTENTLSLLERRMESAAERLDFEYAARLRDRINAIKKLGEKQKVFMCSHASQDVFALASIGEIFCVSVFIFRNNRLSDKKHYFFEGEGEKGAFYNEFLARFYEGITDIPPRILIDTLPQDRELLEKWLGERLGKKVTISVPKAAEPLEILNMCRNNAADNLSHKTEQSGREMSALNELANLLGLERAPRYIEAYDISNTAGDENVAGMIVYRDGKPYKPAYKKFKIKSFIGQDDFRSLAEVLDRRLNEYEKGEDEGFSTLPDLILLDGGSGQISAVEPILKKHRVNIALFGMVKDSKHRTRAIATSGGDIAIKSNRKAFTLVTEIQDEVHRFAIGYHRLSRSKKMLSSALLQIEGIGPKKAKLLMDSFKTVDNIKKASLDELKNVKGFGETYALKVYEHFRNE